MTGADQNDGGLLMPVFVDSAERLLTEKWLATQPEQVILALAQLIRQAQDENVCPNYCHLPAQ